MIRAVLDANVYVSAFVRPEGSPGRIVQRLLGGDFEVVLSVGIVDEVLRALEYPRVLKLARANIDPALWFEDIVVLSQFVTIGDEIPSVSRDADDDTYIAAALEGRAAFVVTGDLDLLDVREYQGIRIVTPRAFLNLLLAA